MAYDIVGTTMVCIHAPGPIAEGDWQTFLDRYVLAAFTGCLVLVDAGSAGPDAGQRARLAACMRGREAPPVAVVTQSAVHRGIVKVIGWLQKSNHMTAFHPSRLAEAMDFARVAAADRAAIHRFIETEVARIGAPQLRTALRLDAAIAP
jgi:hypothetical protein